MSDSPKLYPVKLLRDVARQNGNGYYYTSSVYGFPAEEVAKLIKDKAAVPFEEGDPAKIAWAEFKAQHAELLAPGALVHRMPPLEEYVAAGYKAENYAAFIEEATARAKKEGHAIEVRAPTAAELAERERETPRGPATLETPPDPNLQPAEKPTPPAPVSVAEIRASGGVLESGADAPAPETKPEAATTPPASPRRRR